MSFSSAMFQNNDKDSTTEEPSIPGTPTNIDDTPPSASSRRLAFVLSFASSRSSFSFRSVLSGRYSFSLAAGASAIMGQPEDATILQSPCTGRLSTLSRDNKLGSPHSLRNSVQADASRRNTVQLPDSLHATELCYDSERPWKASNTTMDSLRYAGRDSIPLSLQDVQEDDTLVFDDNGLPTPLPSIIVSTLTTLTSFTDFLKRKTMSSFQTRKSVFLRDSQFKPFDSPSFVHDLNLCKYADVAGRRSIFFDHDDNPSNRNSIGLAPALYGLSEEADEIDLGLVNVASLDNPSNDEHRCSTALMLGLGRWNTMFSDELEMETFSSFCSSSSASSSGHASDPAGNPSGDESTVES